MPVLVGLCRTCSARNLAIPAALRRLQARFGPEVSAVTYDCLAVCHEPAALVGNRVVRIHNGDTAELEREVTRQCTQPGEN